MPRNQGIRFVAMMIFASWIRDKLKGYSRHIEYAMESAEKTGLFQKYVLRKKDGDKWCIGVFDENGRLMELVTSDSPAGAIVEAALIYNRMPKEEKTAGKKGRKVRKRRICRPKRILRILRLSRFFRPSGKRKGSAGEGRCGTFFQEVLWMSVILYSKPHCLECNVLKRFLRDYQISYEERDCTARPEYLDEVKRMGFLGVPVTVVNGTPVRGLQPDRILELLGQKGES